MSRIIGSYVLVSHQSQTCSSHYTEPCITTRTPLDPAVRRGNLLILKYDEDPLVREKYRQSQSWMSWCTAKPQQPSMHSPSTAVPALKDDDDFKNLSASLILCTASQSCAAAKRVHVDSK